MKKYCQLLLFSIFVSCNGGGDVLPQDTYIKFYGFNGTYELTDIVESFDGSGFAMVGNRTVHSDDAGGDDTNPYIFLINQEGDNLNEIEYEIVHQSDDFLEEDGSFTPKYQVENISRITAIDGGYLVVGTSEYPILNTELEEVTVNLIIYAQLDNTLSLVGGINTLGDSVNNYVGIDIAETLDGGVLVAGYTDELGTNDFYYAKIGGTNTEWTRVQERPNSNDQLIRALPTSSGEFAIFGRTEAFSRDGEGGVNVESTIISQEGIIGNSLIYGLTSASGDRDIDDYPFDVIEKPGGFAIIGYSDLGSGDHKPFLMNVDLIGAAPNEILYDTDFDNANLEGRGFSITQTLSNDFIIVGELIDYTANRGDKNEKDRNNELMVMRTNQGGEQIGLVKNFGVENGDDVAIRAFTTVDGSILVGGTYDFGGGESRFALLKMNVNGELKQ
ncbi:MAG: delta-60 repeat domain-containing protein [Cytophagales bacterium]|nr:delta-60 repeat domain-containing protein [Cytophagales bacterium]